MSAAPFGDDRLLRYALGLDDDPDLERALVGDAPLRDRLAAVRGDLDVVDERLRATTPVDPADADPADPRWQKLRPYLDAPAARRRVQRRRLTGALAAAAILAFGVAIVVSGPRHGTTTSTTGAAPAAAPASQADGALGASGGETNGSTKTAPRSVTAEAAAYGIVAVARAGDVRQTAAGARQSFTVVRVLKGAPPDRFTLSVRQSTGGAQAGSLQLVYLQPVARAGESGTPSVTGGSTGTASPLPTPMAAPTTAPAYSYRGSPAVVVALPAGTDPQALWLP